MCGIAGVFDFGRSLPELGAAEHVVQRMIDSLVHRGPDSGGLWADDRRRCVLGHRRLSIIDVSDAGRQPMSSASGRWVVSFNGEIYNFRDVKKVLEAKGVCFHGRTDTEVLIESLAMWGVDALPKFDGMFAFAAFDRQSGELLLARDAFGEKPLYYVELPGSGLAFASELQALEKLPGFDMEVSLDALAEVLMFQYVGAPRTIYRSVSKLPPGHWLRVAPGRRPKIGRFFEFRPGIEGFDPRPIGTLADELEEILERNIRRRLISDVPVGAFLSGGVDSSTVCAFIACKLGLPVKTFSIGFRGATESEHDAARLFAETIGTEHHDQILSPDPGSFLLDIGRILDEPNGDSSCMPTYLLSEFARRKVTVAVSGDGGDEMFLGYGRYFHTLEEERTIGRAGTWNPGKAYYSGRILVSTEAYVEELFGVVPHGLRTVLEHLRTEITESRAPLFCGLRKTDVENYLPGAVLPKVDRMSMRHSLEVRTPYLNIDMARFAERLPLDVLYGEGRGKRILREVAYRYLPKGAVDAPKKGFGIPMSSWGRGSLLSVASSLLEGEESRLREALGAQAIERFMTRQRSSDGFSTYQVWSLAMLESWMRHHPASLREVAAALQDNRTGLAVRRNNRAEGLRAWHIEDNEFAVFEAGDCFASQDSADAEVPTYEEPVKLPGWGEPVSSQLKKELSVLRDAKLFFADPGASEKIDRNELEKYAGLGVAEIEFAHGYMPAGTMVRIRLWHKSAIRRLVSMIMLRRHVVAKVGWKQRLSFLRRAYRGELAQGRCVVLGPLGLKNWQPDCEMSQQYLLFEGLTQQPPVPVRHDHIAEKGNGRHSVWNDQLYFSPTRIRRLLTHSYWLVKRSALTDFLASYVSTVVRSADGLPRDLANALAKWIATEGSALPKATDVDGPIVVITHGLSPGGAERQWCYLAGALKQMGWPVVFVSIENLVGINAHYRPLLAREGIDVIELEKHPFENILKTGVIPGRLVSALLHGETPIQLGHILRLTRLLHSLKPRAVLAQLDYPNLLAAVAGLIIGVPRVVLSFRNYNPSHFPYLHNDWFQQYYQTVVKSARVVLSGNSREANADYAHWIGVSEDRVQWVPNCVDSRDLMPRPHSDLADLRADLGLPVGAPVVLGVFRFSDEKRPLLFLEVCSRLRNEIHDLRVIVVGSGPLQGEMKQFVEGSNLRACTQMLGRRDDVADIMSIASLLLLTSRKEGMPNVVMEAQYLGVPVVASRVGGVPDVVEDGKGGVLVDGDDAANFVRSCLPILRDPHLAKKMGRGGADCVKRYFSRTAMAEKYASLIGISVPAQTDARSCVA